MCANISMSFITFVVRHPSLQILKWTFFFVSLQLLSSGVLENEAVVNSDAILASYFSYIRYWQAAHLRLLTERIAFIPETIHKKTLSSVGGQCAFNFNSKEARTPISFPIMAFSGQNTTRMEYLLQKKWSHVAYLAFGLQAYHWDGCRGEFSDASPHSWYSKMRPYQLHLSVLDIHG